MLFKKKKKKKSRPVRPTGGVGSEIERLEHKFREAPQSRAFFPLAEALRRQGNLQAAAGVLEEGLQFHAEDYGARTSLGRVYMEMGKDDDAMGQLLQVVEKAPENVKAQELLGQLYERCGYVPEAILLVRTMIKRAPQDPRLRDRERHLITRLRRDPFARKETRNGLIQDVVYVYLEFNFLEEAERVLEEILMRSPATPELLKLQADLKRRQSGEEGEAATGEVEQEAPAPEQDTPAWVADADQSVSPPPVEVSPPPASTAFGRAETSMQSEVAVPGTEPVVPEGESQSAGPELLEPEDDSDATVVLEIPEEVIREVESVWQSRAVDEDQPSAEDSSWDLSWEPRGSQEKVAQEPSEVREEPPAVEPPPSTGGEAPQIPVVEPPPPVEDIIQAAEAADADLEEVPAETMVRYSVEDLQRAREADQAHEVETLRLWMRRAEKLRDIVRTSEEEAPGS